MQLRPNSNTKLGQKGALILYSQLLILFNIVLIINHLTNESNAETLNTNILENLIRGINSTDPNYHIKTGDNPFSIHMYYPDNQIGEALYVANSNQHSIWIFDGNTDKKIAEIPVGEYPRGITTNLATNKIYIANGLDNSVSVIDGENKAKIKDIKVGKDPRGMASNDHLNKTYVANFDYDNVTVIDGNTDTVNTTITVGNKPLGVAANGNDNRTYVAISSSNVVSVIDGNQDQVLYNITVGNKPTDIAIYSVKENEISFEKYFLLVTNSGDNTVSVINITSDNGLNPIKDQEDMLVNTIEVGDTPQSIAIDKDEKKAYVANSKSNSVSVIDLSNLANITNKLDINVGDNPYDIAINQRLEKVYVINKDSDSISVIDPISDELVGGVLFNINPLNSGSIRCGINSTLAPVSQYFFLRPNTDCVANPNRGFEFLSWEQNIGDNSTQLVTIQSSGSENLFDFVNDLVYSTANFFGIKYDKEEAILDPEGFAEYTANFRELPPPLPTEYWATLFSVVVSAIIGSWLTPLIIENIKSRKQKSSLEYYNRKISTLFADKKVDTKYLSNASSLKNMVSDGFNLGKINKDQYGDLRNKISVNCERIFKRQINSLRHEDISNLEKEKLKINDSITDAYSDGILTELHYNLLMENLSKYGNLKRE